MSLRPNPLASFGRDLIDYASITPEDIKEAVAAYLVQAREAVTAAADPSVAATWSTIVEPLDRACGPLWRAWSIAGHLNAVVNTPALRDAYNAMLAPVTEYSTWVGLHEGLYHQYQRMKTSSGFASLSAARQRVIELALRNFKLSGVELKGDARQRYAENSEKQSQVSQKFSENVLDAKDKWSLLLTEASRLEGVPQDVLDSLYDEEKQAWVVTLKMPCYLPVMQYAKDRDLRHTLYKAYATVASEFGEAAWDNSALIEESLHLRAAEAELLSFKHFAELRLQTRMAKTDDEVIKFLRELAARAKPFAERDLAELRAYAAKELALTDLQPWDVPFASEHLRETRYAYSEDEVKQYFTEPRVLSGLFEVVENLFEVKLQPIEFSPWHEDARAVEVLNKQGVKVGYLLLDLYARTGKQGGAWVDSERARHKLSDHIELPIINLTCNFAKPQGDRPALWTHDDVITLFHESGHALHALLSEVDEPGASAFAAVEWDAIELPSQFMENFCWEGSVLEQLTAHIETGEPLPRALFDKMTAARNFQSGMQAVRQIEFSLFDMLMHNKPTGLPIKAVLELLEAVRAEVAVLRPPPWHRFPHSFSHLFAGGYGAGYYSYKWAEVLSADAYAAFEEAALASKHSVPTTTLDAVTGARFKKEILAVGGLRSASESFRAFRGRDATIDALLRHSGMTEEVASLP
jgi:oligopeptidase A